MNEQKVKGILGFAAKARQISAGMDACRLLVRSGRCGILLIDDLTGPNTRKKAADLSVTAGTPLMILPEGMIEAATGKSSMILGVAKGSFAEQITAILNAENEKTVLKSSV